MSPRRTLAVTMLVALTAACSPADVGLGPLAGSPADDTADELEERLEAMAGVDDVETSEGADDEDTGEPGSGPTVVVDMAAAASAFELEAVLETVRVFDRATYASVWLGPGPGGRSYDDETVGVTGTAEEMDPARVAELLTATVALVDSSLGSDGIAQVLVDDDTGRPRVRLTVPDPDDAEVTRVARLLAAEPALAGVGASVVGEEQDPSDPTFDEFGGERAETSSLSWGPDGLTDEVLRAWNRVRRAGDRARRTTGTYPEVDLEAPARLGTSVTLPGDPRRRDVTLAAYGDALWPMVRAQLDVLAALRAGSTYVLALDGNLLVDVTTGPVDRSLSYGKLDWDRRAYRYLAALERRGETPSSGRDGSS